MEEDKDEVLKCKGGNRNGEKRDIVEGECKETERVEAECIKDAETVEAESTEAERVEAEHKKEAERVEAESTEAERVEAEHKKEAERVEAESTETERVEAECKKDAETVEAECKTEELCKENEGKSKKSVGFAKSMECNTETVPEDNLDDTCSEQLVNFNPPSLEQIEKHVAQTIEEIRSFGACTESDDGENHDSDSLVIDDQSDSIPPCSQMPHKYGKTN